jgi:hypothetical protein
MTNLGVARLYGGYLNFWLTCGVRLMRAFANQASAVMTIGSHVSGPFCFAL